MKCAYCNAPAVQPFSEDFDIPVCRNCGLKQHEALERIAQMVRPMKWSAPPESIDEPLRSG